MLLADNDLISSDTFGYKGNIYLRFYYIDNIIIWHQLYEDKPYIIRVKDSELESQYKMKKKLERILK